VITNIAADAMTKRRAVKLSGLRSSMAYLMTVKLEPQITVINRIHKSVAPNFTSPDWAGARLPPGFVEF
jgi:hypothetical protein